MVTPSNCSYPLLGSTCEAVIRDCSVVLGARHYLREGHGAGAFQKLLRDAAVVGLFDGSTAVNLDGVALQLSRLSAGRAAPPDERRSRLEAIFDPGAPLPALFSEPLELMTAGRDDVTQGLADSLARLQTLRDGPGHQGVSPPDPETLAALLARARDLARHLDALGQEAARLARDRALRRRTFEAFELARRYCTLFAAASSLHLWTHGRHRLDAWGAGGSWLLLCLDRLLSPLEGAPSPARPGLIDAAAARLLALHDGERAFALVPLPLGRAG